jgi:chitinase
MVSIGGWTGSRFFSTSVASNKNRTKFVKAVTDLAVQYNVGGVDFEYVPFANVVLGEC